MHSTCLAHVLPLGLGMRSHNPRFSGLFLLGDTELQPTFHGPLTLGYALRGPLAWGYGAKSHSLHDPLA